ncbi:MAG: DNA recombination protein RmuC [Alphaproteobacteria bacterium]
MVDPWFLAILTAAILGAAGIIGACLFAALRRPAASPAAEGDKMAELSARLSQLLEHNQTSQDQMSQRLLAQERHLNERLGQVGDKLTTTLDKLSDKNETSLTDLKQRIAVIDAAQKNIADLSGQVTTLQEIFSNKQARGAFGERMMEDMVRDQLPPSVYGFQVKLSNGTLVDCVLRFPEPLGQLSVDSKFPREAYQALRKAGDPEGEARARRAFGAAINKHVKDIAGKYIIPGETAEVALMFVPSEAIFAELHDRHTDVVDAALRAKVYPVSPLTFWATLNVMRTVMRDVRMHEQARLIQHEVLEMMKDVNRLDDRASKLESHFDLARDDIRKVRISTDKLLKRGEKIQGAELEPPEGEATEKAISLDEHRAGRHH